MYGFMEKLRLSKQFQQRCQKVRFVRQLKHLILILLFVTTSLFSKSYSQTNLTLNFKNTEVEKIISFIEKRTDYRFLYQTSEIDLKRRVNINYKGRVLKAVEMLFTGTSVYPVITNKQIVLKKRKVIARQHIISGVVSDTYGIPLLGVDVVVNKIERFTITDENGSYKISAKKGDELGFKLLGFKDYTIKLGNQAILNVTLEEDVNMIDEVVLIGYGQEKRENVSTAVSSVKGKKLGVNLQTGESFDRGLDGLVKGVMVTQGTGELGKGADIIIRGVTSPFSGGNNNPLYVIDGVAISTSGGYNGSNPLQSINPADIESVDILKDAAATAIYGSRGANGVIIIKTKQGLYDQPTTVNLSFKTTFGVPVKTLDYLNASEFKDYILKLNQNSWEYYNSIKNPDVKNNYGLQVFHRLNRYGFEEDGTGGYTYDPSRIKFGKANTNWNKVVFRDAAVTNSTNASVSGGAENSAFNASLGYVNQEGILRADIKKQYSARLSTQFNVSEKLKFGISANYSNVGIKAGYTNTADASFFTSVGAGTLRFRPDLPVYDKNGAFLYDRVVAKDPYTGQESVTLYPNPLAITTLSGQSKRKDDMLIANVSGEYNITDYLMFKTEYSYGIFFSDGKTFKPQQYSEAGYIPKSSNQEEDPNLSFLGEDEQQAGLTTLSIFEGKTINSSINYTLNYVKQFDKNTVKGLLGFSHTHDKTISDGDNYSDFITDIPLPQYAKIKRNRIISIYNSGLNSYFGRISYGYDDKYTFTAVARLDRSSKFAPENRNAFFPSISGNWNIHNENFMHNSFLTKLRLRTSAGLAGSVSVGDFAYLQRFDNVGTRTYKELPSFAFAQNFANRKLQWEKTTEYNTGLDFEVKGGLLRGSVDLYHKTTSDVVSSEYEVVETGADAFQRNNAKILNKGFEVNLGSNIFDNEVFSWSVDVNASKNMNKVLEVSGAITKDDSYSQYYVVGREVNLIKGYVVNGIIQTPERLKELNDLAKSKKHKHYDKAGTAVGDYEFKDINGDGKIDAKDQTIIGSRQPDLFGGFNTTLEYKGIELGINFSYAYGLESLRFNQALNYERFHNIERYMSPQYRWSPTNRTATLPRLIHSGDHNESANNRTSSANIFDASYLRLTSLKLGYNLPEKIISNIGFSRVNIYATGTNLVTWTKFPGLDPQGANAGAASTGNVNNDDGYPSAKTFSIGVNLQF